ncbi:hypothetical protein K438DRAFT_1129913 [Mycena galopus ATCC 62051]|nr:hypothetical protein K438DRAFT_1129913 [Mycena galopus ATCC 62051]
MIDFSVADSAAADDPDEIFFHQGDIVEFIEKQDQEWSLVRKSDGSVGIAPSNNLEYTASTQFGSNKATASSSALVLDSAAATVCHEFIPFLSDELQVAIGEEVRVLSEYDDGWALCKNDHGDQGMVPLECLNRGAGAQTQQARTPDHKSRRTSSMRGFQLVSGDPGSTNLSDPSTAPSELVSPNDYKYKAKARLSYDPPASDKEGLSFRKDEILDVVDTAGKKWKARRTDGSTGIVPSYYFHII